MSQYRSTITATAQHYPTKVVTNDDLAKIVDTSDEWIRTRTGIHERRKVSPGTGSSDLATKAIEKLLKQKKMSAEEIDLIICATITPDKPIPATACIVQAKIGAKNAWGFDLNAACSGFLYALTTADQFIRAGSVKKALVIGVDVMSAIINPQDRNTCVIFGDGCGVVLLEREDKASELGILDYIHHVDGHGEQFLQMPAGGSVKPASIETVENKEHYAQQDGKVVFKQAVTAMPDVSLELLEKNNLKPSDIDYFVPHQANMRIIDMCQKKLKLKDEQVITNIDKFANTTAATIPTCIAKASEEKIFKKGDLIVLASFGAGYTWGASLLRWSY
ncbi:MAG TPA: beta-ketoacyl-ACP synthase III [Oligoflexia bacterium]|nr:beta-ketoacyl-ACP synthase III [Oligoflexia bacterium]HMR24535.1 beta-ketoacyl-ACP synthase III [Oligoflexia bacterium]